MQKIILFMDNRSEYLDVHSRLLEQSGYKVYQATTVEEAEKKLNEKHIHLAILDIRMEDEEDEQDISGLMLAQRDSYRSIPKIILTAYPSYEYAREALGPALNGLPPAVYFIGKAEGPEALIQAVERIFTELVRINWNLKIRWGENKYLTLPHLVTLIEANISNDLLPVRVDEMQDLFRRLFYESRQITTMRLFAVSERKATLAVFVFSKEGLPGRFVITCGQRNAIQKEIATYDKFFLTTTREGATAKYGSIETVHYGAIAYTLTGANLEEIMTLTGFYREYPVEMVSKALAYLFNTTLAQWHRQGENLEEKNLNEAFLACLEVDKALLARSVLAVKISALQSQAVANHLPKIDDASLKLLFDIVEGSTIFESWLRYGMIHKRLKGDNILVDRQGRVWLIDFGQVGPGPLIYDYISLETMIKFDLLDSLDGQERYELENRLLIGISPDEPTASIDSPPDIRKAIQIITYIRQQARRITEGDMKPYYVGLLFATIERLASYDPEIYYTRPELIPYIHGLLSAGMLCQALNPTNDNGNIIIDHDNKVVVVGEKLINLTKLQFKLLVYLDTNYDRVCSRDELFQHLFEEDEFERNESALDTHISRLRKEIEPDPTNPTHITTVRGYGYKFIR